MKKTPGNSEFVIQRSRFMTIVTFVSTTVFIAPSSGTNLHVLQALRSVGLVQFAVDDLVQELIDRACLTVADVTDSEVGSEDTQHAIHVPPQFLQLLQIRTTFLLLATIFDAVRGGRRWFHRADCCGPLLVLLSA